MIFSNRVSPPQVSDHRTAYYRGNYILDGSIQDFFILFWACRRGGGTNAPVCKDYCVSTTNAPAINFPAAAPSGCTLKWPAGTGRGILWHRP